MNAVVVGAGIAGLTAAIRLRSIGWDVSVVERSPGPRDDGDMIDFFGPGYAAAERIGLGPQLETIHYPIEELRYVDGTGRLRFSIPYPAIRRRVFRGRHATVLRGALERLLGIAARDIRIRFGTSPRSIEHGDTGVLVSFDDGEREWVQLVVGADGVHSTVRSLAFGPEAAFRVELGHVTAAFVLDALPHGARSHAFTTLTDAGRMVAVYPTPDDRAATFFVHRTGDARAELGEPPEAVLRRRYGDLGWVVPELLAALDGRDVHLDEVVQIRVPRWHAGRVVLLGDAAWCVSLLAGNGASLALAGAERLAEALDGCGDDVEVALGIWERELRPAVESAQAAGRRTAAYFVPEDRLRMWVRDATLRAAAWPVAAHLARRSIGVGKVA